MPKLPRTGTIARDVLDYLADFSKPDAVAADHGGRGCSFSELLDAYVYSSKTRGHGGRRAYASMNLTRILKAHAHKTGPEGSRAVWLFGPKPPAPKVTDLDLSMLPPIDQLIGPNHVLMTYPPQTKQEAFADAHPEIVADKPFESDKTKELRRVVEKGERLLKESIENDVLLCEMQKEVSKFHDSKTLLILREAVDERLRQISAEVIK